MAFFITTGKTDAMCMNELTNGWGLCLATSGRVLILNSTHSLLRYHIGMPCSDISLSHNILTLRTPCSMLVIPSTREGDYKNILCMSLSLSMHHSLGLPGISLVNDLEELLISPVTTDYLYPSSRINTVYSVQWVGC